MDDYATHLPLLAWAVGRTSGAVLEFGSGEYSTGLLHTAVVKRDRILVSGEIKADWHARIKGLFPAHRNWIYDLVDDWAMWKRPEDSDFPIWSVVLIDHWPSKRRNLDLVRMAHRASLVVVHDAEPATPYGYQFDHYAHRYQDTTWPTQTAVVSNFINVEEELR